MEGRGARALTSERAAACVSFVVDFAALARRFGEGFASIARKLRGKRKILGVAGRATRRYEAQPFAAQQRDPIRQPCHAW